MSVRSLLPLLFLAACTQTCPEGDTTPTGGDDTEVTTDSADTADTGETDPNALTTEERTALDSWTTNTAAMTPLDGGPVYIGDRLAILLTNATIEDLDVVTAVTRAQDHNSSRSNKTSSIIADDDFGDGDTASAGKLTFAWDGRGPCAALPCVSNERPDGASSRLVIEPGAAMDDGHTALTWGETTGVEEEFSGYLAIAYKGGHGGHVTVLKASATDSGTIMITTEMNSNYLAIFDDEGPLYEAKPELGVPLASISGVTGTSWPHGIAIDQTAMGTLVSFTW